MVEIRAVSVAMADPAQATSLSALVELEARWENLKKTRTREQEVRANLHDLQSKQKAYDAFRAKLVAYNKQYKPAHVPELLLNTPVRLGTWCRSMRNLYVQVQNDLQSRCPVQLLEKAYRWADMLGARLNKPLVSRSTPPGSVSDAIRDLEALSTWCDDLIGAAAPALPPPTNLTLLRFEESWSETTHAKVAAQSGS